MSGEPRDSDDHDPLELPDPDGLVDSDVSAAAPSEAEAPRAAPTEPSPVADLFGPAPPLPAAARALADRVAGGLARPRRWSPTPGGYVGPLVLEQRIGRGGMGEVWRARGPDGVPLAVKLLGPGWDTDPRSEERLRREQAALAALDDPAIVRPRGGGATPDGAPWLAMDLIPGARSLDEALRDGLEAERALDALEAVARALGKAHRGGLVHRDVKPGNILLGVDGRARLVDFGLVHAAGAPRLTSTGDVWGTPGFIAPERLGGGDVVGPAADVFGLGATLHKVLTGVPPSRSPLDPAASVALPAHVPVALAGLVQRSLARDPARRPGDGEAFAEELRRARAGSSPRRPGRPALTGAAGVVVAVLVGLALLPAAEEVDGGRPDERTADPATPAPVSATPAAVDSGGLPWPLPAGLAPAEVAGQALQLADGSRLAWIPGGTLSMGVDDDSEDGPVHAVRVEGFFLGVHELDWGRYRLFCKATGRDPPPATIPGEPPFEATDHHPVFGVTLSQAMAYCAWAGLRLPTEAEWEWAARGPDGRAFPWGEVLPTDGTKVANLADRTARRAAPPDFGECADDYDDGHFYPSPCGAFPAGASPAGCLDLAGNVWEWTADEYRPYPGRPPLSERRQVIRGGSWDNPPRFVRATKRGAAEPGKARPFLGFRVARGL